MFRNRASKGCYAGKWWVFVALWLMALGVDAAHAQAYVKLTGPSTTTYAAPASFGLVLESHSDSNTKGEHLENVQLLRNGQVVNATILNGTYNEVGMGAGTYDYVMKADAVRYLDGDEFRRSLSSQTVRITVNPAPPPSNDAAFVSQSVPGRMAAGYKYAVSIQMRNSGVSTWSAAQGYKLGVQADGWGVARVELPYDVAPGQTVTFNFIVTATTSLSPNADTYIPFQWRMLREGVEWFGPQTPYTSVLIEAPVNAAKFVSQSALPAAVMPGQRFTATVQMANIGDKTWSTASRYALGSQNPQDNSTWGNGRIALPGDVLPGQTATFTFTAVAPNTPGTYNFQWRMVQDGVEWFGVLTPSASIVVANGSISASPNPCTIAWTDSTCSTTISWNTSAASNVEVWVSGLDGSNPKLFAGGVSGAQAAPWITSAGARFMLKGSGLTLATVDVKANVQSAPAPMLGVYTSYDALGRVTQVTQDSEQGQLTTSTQYRTGFMTVTTDARGYQSITAYAAYGEPDYSQPVNVDMAVGTPEETLVEIQRDVFGKPRSVRRYAQNGGLSLTRSYVYDGNHQLCKRIDPEGGATVMAYDGAGNLQWSAAGLSFADTSNCNLNEAASSGRVVARTYDLRNRVKTLSFPDGRGNQIWNYELDGLPRTVSTDNDGPGQGTVVNAYSYNKRRLPISETLSIPGRAQSRIGYDYDALGHLAVHTYPSGLVVNYAPDALGNPTQVGTYAQSVKYYPNGAVRSFTYGNGIPHTMTQNARQLPQRSTDTGILDLETSFDQNGNVGQIFDRLRGSQYDRTLQYDALNRLTAAGSCHFGGDCWHRFSYDALDNLTAWKLAGVKDYSHYVYDASNRLASIQNQSGAVVVGLGYDVQGNLANKNGESFVFDFGNRLREVTSRERYRYDSGGYRVSSTRWTDGATASYHYASDGKLLYAQDDRTGERSDYIYLSGSAVAVRSVGADNQPHVKYQHTDALGSPVAVSNEAGGQIDRTDWEPYGAAIGKPTYDGLGYTGHMMDGATGLTYMQQRYYDADVGRFLSVDPVTADESGNWEHFSRYSYAYNNPYKFNDPDGRCPICCPMCVGFLIGAGIEIGLQLAIDGKISNWTAVGVSGTVGAVTGGLGSVIGKAAVSGTISTGRAVASTAVVGGATSATGKVAEGALTGQAAGTKEVVVATVAGAAGGAVGAKVALSGVAKLEGMVASNSIAGHIGKTTQTAVQKGGKIAESTSFAQKAAGVATDSASSYVEKRINK
jgi:RHS repeat-associated protein